MTIASRQWKWFAFALVTLASTVAVAADPAPRCLAIEFYIHGSQADEVALAADLESYAAKRAGIRLRIMNVDEQPAHEKRLAQLRRHFALKDELPLLYGCGQAVVGAADATAWQRQLDALRTMTVYVRSGCPRCAKAKTYLPTLAKTYPGVLFVLRDIAADRQAANDLQAVVAKYKTAAASVPVFHFCNQVIVGFSDAQTSGARLEGALQTWAQACPVAKRPADRQSMAPPRTPILYGDFLSSLCLPAFVVTYAQEDPNNTVEEEPLPLPLPTELPLPSDEGESAVEQSAIVLPLLGPVSVESLGLPLFTIAVGLVDGFNPCAMWVLLFLLSVLVNVHSRWRMLAVAGTFVVISGAVYFAFMAAWISIFQFIGLLRVVQVVLALVAIGVGAIHVKDFFAFKQGISLSIPESAKPQIYQRVRGIVTAQNVTGAIAGAAVLAVLVNMLELLCTAGLPALYTQILTVQQLPVWANYAYLLLYNAAYMFDDSLMVGLVVITMGHQKMQEAQGRWLKLISGTAIIVLGAIMLLRPEWLGM